jgi:hypothetical protein
MVLTQGIVTFLPIFSISIDYSATGTRLFSENDEEEVRQDAEINNYLHI